MSNTKMPRSIQLRIFRQEIVDMDVSVLPHRNAYLNFWDRAENLIPSVKFLSDEAELLRRCDRAFLSAERIEKMKAELMKWLLAAGIVLGGGSVLGGLTYGLHYYPVITLIILALMLTAIIRVLL